MDAVGRESANRPRRSSPRKRRKERERKNSLPPLNPQNSTTLTQINRRQMPLQHIQSEEQIDVFAFHDGERDGEIEVCELDLSGMDPT